MGGLSSLELGIDTQGNKYLNFDEVSQYKETECGRRLIDYEIMQIISEEKDENEEDANSVAKVRSLNNNKIYAMKRMSLSTIQKTNMDQYLDKVMNKLNKLNNPHIIKYYNYFIEGENLYIIMEYMNNSDIIGFIQAHKILNENISEEVIWNILLQCLSALDYLHKQNLENIGLKLTHIFMNNEQNAKIGVFNDMSCMKKNINEREDIYILGKYFYLMMNSAKDIGELIKRDDYINELDYEKVENNLYSNELQEIVNSMSIHNTTNIVNVENLYERVKDKYVKKYAKNSSIEAVIRCLFAYKLFNDKINSQKQLFKDNKEKYYINYWYSQAIEAIAGLGEVPLNLCIEEFRRAIASSFSKLDGNKEIDPLILLTFLLVMMHNETNEVEGEQDIKNGENKKQKSNFVISSSFNGEEEDKCNKMQMWDKFITKFNARTHSPISDLFFGFIKRKDICQTCRTGYYSFYNYFYIIFNLSNRDNNKDFDLIEDGFKAQHLNYKLIGADGPDKMICDRCSTYQKYKEFNRYYMLKDHLIICFIRGNHFQNKSKIKFSENIDLKDFIEPDINSPHKFYLVGTIIRNYEQENFVSYSRDYYNQYCWHCSKTLDIPNKEIGYSPIKDIEEEEKNGQIIMLFYTRDEIS